MYYSVETGSGKTRLHTAVSAESPFEAAVIAFRRTTVKEPGILTKVTGDDDKYYIITNAIFDKLRDG
jgi:hypothetical protein